MVHLSSHYGHRRSFADKDMIGRLASLNAWESFSCLLLICVMLLLLH